MTIILKVNNQKTIPSLQEVTTLTKIDK